MRKKRRRREKERTKEGKNRKWKRKRERRKGRTEGERKGANTPFVDCVIEILCSREAILDNPTQRELIE